MPARGHYPEPSSSLFVLKRARKSNGTQVGGIIPVQQVRALVDLVPRFGKKADQRMTSNTSLIYSEEFWLNKYFDKELFYALSSLA